MKKHPYYKLRLGDVNQYCRIVPLAELDAFRAQGWLPYTEIGLPEGEEEAWMLYGEFDKATEMLMFNRPTRLHDVPKADIVGRRVKEVESSLGTYGMGGPGFFGLLLDTGVYVVYAVWGAGDYVLVNGRVVECSPEFYAKVRPWWSNFGDDRTWDELTPLTVGAVITDYTMTDDVVTINLEKDGTPLEILYVKNDSRLPRRIGRKKNAYKKGTIADHVLMQHEVETLIT